MALSEAQRRVEIDPSLPHYEVRVFLANSQPGPEFDTEFARLANLEPGRAYSTDLNVIVPALLKLECWWHLSHIEGVVIPTTPCKGAEAYLSNATAYDRHGNPIRFSTILFRDEPAYSLCVSLIKAIYDLPPAYFIHASAGRAALGEKDSE